MRAKLDAARTFFAEDWREFGGIVGRELVALGLLGFFVIEDSWMHHTWQLVVSGVIFVFVILLGVWSAYLKGKVKVQREWIAWNEAHREMLDETKRIAREVERRVDLLRGKFDGPA